MFAPARARHGLHSTASLPPRHAGSTRRRLLRHLTRQRLKRGVFRSVIDLEVPINRFVAGTTSIPNPSSGPPTQNACSPLSNACDGDIDDVGGLAALAQPTISSAEPKLRSPGDHSTTDFLLVDCFVTLICSRQIAPRGRLSCTLLYVKARQNLGWRVRFCSIPPHTAPRLILCLLSPLR